MTRLLMMLIMLLALALGACNTISGIGKDTQETGDFISGTPAHQAYHQSARDF